MNALTQARSFLRQQRLGVRAKLVLTLLIALLVTLSINSLLALRAQKQDILDESNRRGHEAAHFISHYLAYSVVSYDYHTLELLLQDLVKNGDIVYARVENVRGNVMAAAGADPANGTTQGYSDDIRLNDELLGRLYLSLSTQHITSTLEARKRDTLLRQMLVILAVMLAVFAALSAFIIRPLTIFSRVIASNLDNAGARLQRVPSTSNDEFGALARGFNSLHDRLDDARLKLESRIDLADRELQEAYHQLAAQAQALRDMNRELEQLSVTDSLTGLYNRRYFEKLMESEVALSIRNDETISILLLDINQFRRFNEHHGHDVGDEVIRSVAAIIASHVRHTDVACRYGGDEFFILCRRATISNAVSTADNLQQALTETPLPIRDQSLRLSVSIGVATIPGVYRVSSAEEFFHCADEALRYAKQHAQNDGVAHFSMLPGTKVGAL
jgi:diguanylate cyclase (GGDEF)-like protein